MMKVVLKLELREGDEKSKQKAMTIASGLSGVDSVAMDMKDKKLTITGNIDPVKVVGKLRKICRTEIITVGPSAKQEDNKKKDDAAKKDDGGAKKDDKQQQQQQQSKDQKKPAGGDDQKNKGGAGDQNAAVKFFPQQQPPQFYYPHQMIQQHPYNMNYYPNNYNNYRHPEHAAGADQSDTCVIS